MALVQNVYNDDFYLWWEQQLPALEQFPYAGMDFWGENDLILLLGGAWGATGILVFKFLNFYEFLVIKIYTYV